LWTIYIFLKSKLKVALWKVWQLISFVNQTFEYYKTYQCYNLKSDECESWEEMNILFSLRQWNWYLKWSGNIHIKVIFRFSTFQFCLIC